MRFDIGLFTVLASTTAFADFKVQFKAGDVKVKSQNRTAPLSIAAKLSPNDTVLTGKNGRAALVDLTSGNVVMISSDKSILLSTVAGAAVHNPATLRREVKERQVNTMAAVRANETGAPTAGLGWDEGTAVADHSATWADYKAGKFEKVRAATAVAADPEGLFLQAQSTYMIIGSKDSAKIEQALEKVLQSSLSIPIKSEAQKTLAILAFERGDFEKAYTLSAGATKSLAEADIDAPLYYIFILSARMSGEDAKADAALAQMRKYYPDSTLLKKIDTM